MDLHWHVGDVVKKLREQRRWNQHKLAAAAGLNKATIVRVEENATGIKRETYEAIARALAVTPGELFSAIPQETQRATTPSSASAGETFRTGTYAGPERRRADAGPPTGRERRAGST